MHFFFNVFIYFPSLHVSSNPLLIIRRIELYQYIIWYMSLCVGDCLVGRSGRTWPDQHTRQSPTQSDIYQMMYWQIQFSWWWALGWSKRVEKGN